MNVCAVIPSVGHANTSLDRLVWQLHADEIPTIVVDNRGTLPAYHAGHAKLEVHDGMGIYAVWNYGIDWAALQEAEWCCVFNDDISLEDHAVPQAVAALAGMSSVWVAGFDAFGEPGLPHVRYTTGTWREHGVPGWAFMIRPDCGVRLDEGFGWWGGDDDLIWSVNQAGGVCAVVEGVICRQLGVGGNSSRFYPECAQALPADHRRLMEKWGKSWT